MYVYINCCKYYSYKCKLKHMYLWLNAAFAGKVVNKTKFCISSIYMAIFIWKIQCTFQPWKTTWCLYINPSKDLHSDYYKHIFHLHKCLTSQIEVCDFRKLTEGKTIFPCTALSAHCRIYGISDPRQSNAPQITGIQNHCDKTKPLQLLNSTSFVQ